MQRKLFPHLQPMFGLPEIQQLHGELIIQSIVIRNAPTKQYALASLGSVVVYGCPPEAIRICSRVSLKSFPATPLSGAAAAALGGAEVLAELSGIGWPSRIAFSRANFSARAFLSASI